MTDHAHMVGKRNKKTDEPHVAFGLAVKERRNERDISQEDLGELADLHRTFISDIERGARNPTITTVFKIARALKINPSKLVEIAER